MRSTKVPVLWEKIRRKKFLIEIREQRGQANALLGNLIFHGQEKEYDYGHFFTIQETQ